jgi:hypothetical protein
MTVRLVSHEISGREFVDAAFSPVTGQLFHRRNVNKFFHGNPDIHCIPTVFTIHQAKNRVPQ